MFVVNESQNAEAYQWSFGNGDFNGRIAGTHVYRRWRIHRLPDREQLVNRLFRPNFRDRGGRTWRRCG